MAIWTGELDREWDAEVIPFPAAIVRRKAARARLVHARRRLLVVVAAVTTIVAVLAGGGPEGSTVGSLPLAPDSVVLRSGETLWDLAERYAPESVDPRAYVDALERLNEIEGVVRAGQRVELPQ
jgi:hypothetical protein